ncbi:hypothetical protein HNP33_004041 [Comamonas odontotermitis]|uniref:Uncharacterized protein n=1 Tax=Comamonas odontotermitis TaxID=379895 RepID=A0ABR6RLI6_9BURK|nr:hypothetical protein [Comamonas odontotermitis]MBB6579917.1 hypothetical protein [Comamonas odontotermitis]
MLFGMLLLAGAQLAHAQKTPILATNTSFAGHHPKPFDRKVGVSNVLAELKAMVNASPFKDVLPAHSMLIKHQVTHSRADSVQTGASAASHGYASSANATAPAADTILLPALHVTTNGHRAPLIPEVHIPSNASCQTLVAPSSVTNSVNSGGNGTAAVCQSRALTIAPHSWGGALPNLSKSTAPPSSTALPRGIGHRSGNNSYLLTTSTGPVAVSCHHQTTRNPFEGQTAGPVTPSTRVGYDLPAAALLAVSSRANGSPVLNAFPTATDTNRVFACAFGMNATAIGGKSCFVECGSCPLKALLQTQLVHAQLNPKNKKLSLQV